MNRWLEAVDVSNVSNASMASGLFFDGLDGARDDRVYAELAKFNAGAAWITAIDTVGRSQFRPIVQMLEPYHLRCDCQLQRGIGQSCMGTDLGITDAVLAQDFVVAIRAGAVILRRHKGASTRAGPAFVEMGDDQPDIILVTAVVAEKDDIADTMHLEAVCRRFKGFLECVVRYGDGAGKTHVRSCRRIAALRYIGDHRCHDGVAQTLSDALREHLHASIVLAERNVGAALFGAADGDDDGGLAGLNLVAQFGPGQIFKQYSFRGLRKDGLRGDEKNDGCESAL